MLLQVDTKPERRSIFRRLAAVRFELHTLVFFQKDGPEALPKNKVVELDGKQLATLKTADNNLPWQHELGEMSDLEKNHRVFAVEHEGRYLSFGWATEADKFNFVEVRSTVHLTKPAWWIRQCFTMPAYRGLGLYPSLLRGIRRLTGEAPTLIYIVPENQASRRGISKAGFKETFRIDQLRLTQHRSVTLCTRKPGSLYSYREALSCE